jgi:hypothetical protein
MANVLVSIASTTIVDATNTTILANCLDVVTILDDEYDDSFSKHDGSNRNGDDAISI